MDTLAAPPITTLDLAGAGIWVITTESGTWVIDLDELVVRHDAGPAVAVIAADPVSVGVPLRVLTCPHRDEPYQWVDGAVVTAIYPVRA